MPFDFKKFDAKCSAMNKEELQREWEHYTRLISGAATSTAVSGVAMPLTLGVSAIGVGLAAPAIHNARKKREIIERHLNRLGTSHNTRKRDVFTPMAISGTVGVVTLGVGSMGADAITNSAAQHGFQTVAQNELIVKASTHLALDAVAMAGEEEHMKNKKSAEAYKIALAQHKHQTQMGYPQMNHAQPIYPQTNHEQYMNYAPLPEKSANSLAPMPAPPAYVPNAPNATHHSAPQPCPSSYLAPTQIGPPVYTQPRPGLTHFTPFPEKTAANPYWPQTPISPPHYPQAPTQPYPSQSVESLDAQLQRMSIAPAPYVPSAIAASPASPPTPQPVVCPPLSPKPTAQHIEAIFPIPAHDPQPPTQTTYVPQPSYTPPPQTRMTYTPSQTYTPLASDTGSIHQPALSPSTGSVSLIHYHSSNSSPGIYPMPQGQHEMAAIYQHSYPTPGPTPGPMPTPGYFSHQYPPIAEKLPAQTFYPTPAATPQSETQLYFPPPPRTPFRAG